MKKKVEECRYGRLLPFVWSLKSYKTILFLSGRTWSGNQKTHFIPSIKDSDAKQFEGVGSIIRKFISDNLSCNNRAGNFQEIIQEALKVSGTKEVTIPAGKHHSSRNHYLTSQLPIELRPVELARKLLWSSGLQSTHCLPENTSRASYPPLSSTFQISLKCHSQANWRRPKWEKELWNVIPGLASNTDLWSSGRVALRLYGQQSSQAFFLHRSIYNKCLKISFGMINTEYRQWLLLSKEIFKVKTV